MTGVNDTRITTRTGRAQLCRRFYRSNLPVPPGIFCFMGLWLFTGASAGALLILFTVNDTSFWGHGFPFHLVLFLPGCVWAALMTVQLLFDFSLRAGAVALNAKEVRLYRNINMLGSEQPYSYGCTDSKPKRYELEGNKKRRLGKAIELDISRIIRIYDYSNVIVMLGLVSSATQIEVFNADGTKKRYALKHSVKEYGAFMERLGLACPNLKEFNVNELRTTDKEYQHRIWQKEPDWDLIAKIQEKCERNKKKAALEKEQEQQS